MPWGTLDPLSKSFLFWSSSCWMQWLEMTLVGSTATSKRCGDHSITVNLDQVTDEYSCENCRRQ